MTFEEILVYHAVAQEGEALHHQHCVQWGWGTADLDSESCRLVERLEDLNPIDMPSY